MIEPNQGFRTEDDWKFQFKCEAVNTSTPPCIELVAVDATGIHTKPNLYQRKADGVNQWVTTLTTGLYMLLFKNTFLMDQSPF